VQREGVVSLNPLPNPLESPHRVQMGGRDPGKFLHACGKTEKKRETGKKSPDPKARRKSSAALTGGGPPGAEVAAARGPAAPASPQRPSDVPAPACPRAPLTSPTPKG